jgi:WD repeat-containing protein 23
LSMQHHPSDPEEPHDNSGIAGRPKGGVQMVVRDVAWHTQEPVLMSCSWASSGRKSEVARHEWKGLNKLGGRVEDFVEKEQRESQERVRGGPSDGWHNY